ncbi:DUF4199 domain-containing protein [Aquimarina sp. D1M17]|uniref:DUF4199 domain-containing protein n=1 Tax=Aquimarina acroporae TaxID=2937283 RepID=UPI0020C12345|nr:DUF4199 domain-containing protein [Aquimarina acroporae]MCK8523040.1 DUF4199 domain-containing protein [Aquimarina acroporae]
MRPNNKTSINKHILKYGLIYGCIWLSYRAIIYLFFDSLTTPKKWIIEGSIIDLFLYIGGVTYAIYLFKKKNNSYLKFLDALKIGIVMGIFTFIFNKIWELLYINIINPEYLNNILERSKETKMLKNPELPAKEIDQITSRTRDKFDFYMDLFGLLFYVTLCSFIASLAGAIMHKKKKL